jgi:hypothetical protein
LLLVSIEKLTSSPIDADEVKVCENPDEEELDPHEAIHVNIAISKIEFAILIQPLITL